MVGDPLRIKNKILFEPVTYVDIMLAAQCCEIEVSGLAEVKKDANTYTIFGEPIIFEQKCSINGTHLDISAHGKWIDEMCRAGQQEVIKMAKLWWHSHVCAGAYFSDQDRYTIDNVLGGSLDEWWLALVVNKRFEMLLELDIFRPQRLDPIEIETVSFTEKITGDDLRKLLIERRAGMKKIIKGKVGPSARLGPRRKSYELKPD